MHKKSAPGITPGSGFASRTRVSTLIIAGPAGQSLRGKRVHVRVINRLTHHDPVQQDTFIVRADLFRPRMLD